MGLIKVSQLKQMEESLRNTSWNLFWEILWKSLTVFLPESLAEINVEIPKETCTLFSGKTPA